MKKFEKYINMYTPEKEEPTKVTLRMLKGDHKELTQKCEEYDVSMNALINIAIRAMLDEEPVVKRKLRE